MSRKRTANLIIQFPQSYPTQSIPPVFPTPTEHLKNLGNVKAAVRRNLRPLSSHAPNVAVMEACADKNDWRHDEARAIRDAWRPAPIFRSGPIVHAPIVDDDEATVAPSTDEPCFYYDEITDQTADAIYKFALQRAVTWDYLRQEGFAEDEAQEFTDLMMARIASGSYRDEGKPFEHYLSSQWRLFRFTRWHDEYEKRKKFGPIREVGTGEFDENGDEYCVAQVELENVDRFTKKGWLIPQPGKVHYAFDTEDYKARLAAAWPELSQLEKDIYLMRSEGKTQEQVAERLDISVRTVSRQEEETKQRFAPPPSSGPTPEQRKIRLSKLNEIREQGRRARLRQTLAIEQRLGLHHDWDDEDCELLPQEQAVTA